MKKKEKPDKPEKMKQPKKEKKAKEPKKPKKEKKPKESRKSKKTKNLEKPKKKFKVLILIPAVLVLIAAIVFAAFLLIGNAEAKKAEKSVKGMFSSFQDLDFEKAAKYIDLEALDVPQKNKAFGDTEMFMHSLFNQLDYQIVSSEKIDSDTIVVKTSITAIKIKPIMADFIVQALSSIYSNIVSPEPISDEEMEEKKSEIFAECASKPDLETVTNEVDIKVIYADDMWMIIADEPLVNALFGGLIDIDGDFFAPDPPEAATEQAADKSGH